MIALGIDPGTRRAGYGLVRKVGTRFEFLDAGILAVDSKSNNQQILAELCTAFREICATWQPEVMAIEKLFFTKNRRTGIAVAEARGVIIAEACLRNVPIVEFSPNEVKLGIAGFGGADKRAVAKMVRLTLNTPQLRVIDDASDALALAILGAQATRLAAAN